MESRFIKKREVFIEHTNSVMINRALELGRPIETKDYDEIVRDEMQKLNPSMNPWSIQAHFLKMKMEMICFGRFAKKSMRILKN